MKISRQLTVVLISVVFLLACAPQDAQSQRRIPASFEAVMAQAERIVAVRHSFGQARPHRNELVSKYVESLRQEGFKCRLQYQKRFSTKAGLLTSAAVPGIECVTDGYESKTCIEFRVSIAPDWSANKTELKAYIQELNHARIADAYFICETDAWSNADNKEFVEAIKNGSVVPLDP